MTQKASIAGNTNTSLLKLIALLFMFLDHAGKMCFPDLPDLRVLGRIAFPLYCWCMVVGAANTRCFPRYILRIGLIGLISQPLYMVALHHPWNDFNIFLTLLVALLGLWGLREKKYCSHIWAPVVALALAWLLDVDYGWKGVLLILLLWAVKDSRPGIAAVMVAFCLYWGSSSYTLGSLFGLSLTGFTRTRLGMMLSPFLRMQGMALLSLPLMLWTIPGQVRLPKWAGYAIYPAHLVLLIGLEYLMGKTVHWEHLGNAWQQFIALF
ncbi:MAG: hypothetical protein IKL25_01650 [Clostridia bacterium]|nr:hypothetical protein [Clostridia bacterium]